MDKTIAEIQQTKRILKEYNLHASKNFGQNFLIDVNVVKTCAEKSHSEGAVIEIGTGIGSLTQQLSYVSKHVLSYEIDLRLTDYLKDTFGDVENVEIRFEDFLKSDVKAVVSELKEKYGSVSVCANLPYYITTPILFELFQKADEVDYITVMMQKEVGDRMQASTNDKDYAALSVLAQYLYDVEEILFVPKHAFYPAPKVDSVVLQFHRKKDMVYDEDFATFVRTCFQQRRKTISNNLKDYFPSKEKMLEAFEKVGIEPSQRAQELYIEQLRQLYEESKH